jgi:hypothetical protein
MASQFSFLSCRNWMKADKGAVACRGDLSSEVLAKLEAVRRRKRSEDGRSEAAIRRRAELEVVDESYL